MSRPIVDVFESRTMDTDEMKDYVFKEQGYNPEFFEIEFELHEQLYTHMLRAIVYERQIEEKAK